MLSREAINTVKSPALMSPCISRVTVPASKLSRCRRKVLRSPDIMLSYAADQGVAPIVIGAYSHARSVEMVFGGVTRTSLKQAPIPVLMSR
jgi:nucleotide-binding universal stress UspA family protein